MNLQHLPMRAVAFFAWTTSAHGQQILTPPGPIPAGIATPINVVNDQSSSFWLAHLTLLQPTGELILPELPLMTDAPIVIGPGKTVSLGIHPPASGPGSRGSFLLLYPAGKTAVARIDVVEPDASFPTLHAFPAGVHLGYGSYSGVVWGDGTMTANWRIANTSTTPLTLGAGDRIAVRIPGASADIAAASLAGTLVPPGRSIVVPVPLEGLAIAPYDVVVTLQDPVVGTIERQAGLHHQPLNDQSLETASLHMPGGTTVPAGGRLPAYLRYFVGVPRPVAAAPTFALLVGTAPGTTTGGTSPAIPLVPDPIVLASLNGLSGALPGNVGMMEFQEVACLCASGFYRSPNLEISHPGVAAIQGVPLRVAAVLFVPGRGFTASQSMPLRFE